MNTFVVHRDSIDLIITAVIVAGLHGDRETPSKASQEAIAHADDLGEMLLQENIAAVNLHYGTDLSAPAYEWRPVLELTGLSLTPVQLVQVEKTRRGLERQLQELPDWTSSRAKRLLDVLGNAVVNGLGGWPTVAGDVGTHTCDYEGMAQAVEHWTRDSGFPALTPPSTQAQS